MYPFSTAAAGWEPRSPERPTNPLPQNNNIARTSAAAMKVRKVRSAAGRTADDTSLWADRPLDKNPITACELVSLRAEEQVWSLGFKTAKLSSGRLGRAGKSVMGNDSLLWAPSLLLVEIPSRYRSSQRMSIGSIQKCLGLSCKSDLGKVEQPS